MTDTTHNLPSMDMGAPAPSMMDVLTAKEASDLIDAIEKADDVPPPPKATKRVRVRGIQLKKEILPVAAPTKRVRVKGEKKETLPVPSEGKRLTPRVNAAAIVKLDPDATMYRLDSTPRGKALFTYTLAVFSALGGFSAHRASMDPAAIKGFFRSPSILRHHRDAGNLEDSSKGVRLSIAGWNYFFGRITGSTVAQKVDEPEMQALLAGIKSGKLEKSTARFELSTRFVPVAKS